MFACTRDTQSLSSMISSRAYKSDHTKQSQVPGGFGAAELEGSMAVKERPGKTSWSGTCSWQVKGSSRFNSPVLQLAFCIWIACPRWAQGYIRGKRSVSIIKA